MKICKLGQRLPHRHLKPDIVRSRQARSPLESSRVLGLNWTRVTAMASIVREGDLECVSGACDKIRYRDRPLRKFQQHSAVEGDDLLSCTAFLAPSVDLVSRGLGEILPALAD